MNTRNIKNYSKYHKLKCMCKTNISVSICPRIYYA
jgi:hypothetical protein